MEQHDKLARFEQSIMPHSDAAYNLARWLARSDPDAQDIVQEAYLRAFRFFDGFRGGNSRAWLLCIVRRVFYDWLKRNHREEPLTPWDGELHEALDPAASPDEQADRQVVHQAIGSLALEFREVLILRELEGLSYKEIAEVADVPLGTVMSRLARGREQLREVLMPRLENK